MKEVWKDIKGYEGLYQVSNLGRVRSLNKNTITYNRWGKFERTVKGRILRINQNKLGYCYINLYKEHRCSKFKVHRLVANAFIPSQKDKLEVNHIDGNKTNNKINNLEWCNRSENMKHAIKNGLSKGRKK